MSLFKVTVNGQALIVDAPSKAAAKNFGKTQVKVEVSGVSKADLDNIDLSTVPVVEAKVKAPAAEAAAE